MCIDKHDTGQLHLSNKQRASCELGQRLLALLGAQVRAFVGQQSWLPADKWILVLQTRNSAQQHKQVRRTVQWGPALSTQGSELYHTFATAETACAPFYPKIYQGRNSQRGSKIGKTKKNCVSSLWCFLQWFCLSVRIKYKSFACQLYPSYSLGSRKLLAESPDTSLIQGDWGHTALECRPHSV